MRHFILLVVAVMLTLSHVEAGCAIPPDANGYVQIPEGDTEVAVNAFNGCKTLKRLSLPILTAQDGSRQVTALSTHTTIRAIKFLADSHRISSKSQATKFQRLRLKRYSFRVE